MKIKLTASSSDAKEFLYEKQSLEHRLNKPLRVVFALHLCMIHNYRKAGIFAIVCYLHSTEVTMPEILRALLYDTDTDICLTNLLTSLVLREMKK